MIGPWPCAYAIAYVDPVFASQSYEISISMSTRRTNLCVFLVLMLMLMPTQFSLAYTCACACACACAYAYAYALAKTRLNQHTFYGVVYKEAPVKMSTLFRFQVYTRVRTLTI